MVKQTLLDSTPKTEELWNSAVTLVITIHGWFRKGLRRTVVSVNPAPSRHRVKSCPVHLVGTPATCQRVGLFSGSTPINPKHAPPPTRNLRGVCLEWPICWILAIYWWSVSSATLGTHETFGGLGFSFRTWVKNIPLEPDFRKTLNKPSWSIFIYPSSTSSSPPNLVLWVTELHLKVLWKVLGSTMVRSTVAGFATILCHALGWSSRLGTCTLRVHRGLSTFSLFELVPQLGSCGNSLASGKAQKFPSPNCPFLSVAGSGLRSPPGYGGCSWPGWTRQTKAKALAMLCVFAKVWSSRICSWVAQVTHPWGVCPFSRVARSFSTLMAAPIGHPFGRSRAGSKIFGPCLAFWTLIWWLWSLVLLPFPLPEDFPFSNPLATPFPRPLPLGFIVLGKEFWGSLDFCPRRFFLLELKGLPLAAAVTRPLSLWKRPWPSSWEALLISLFKASNSAPSAVWGICPCDFPLCPLVGLL